MIAEQETGEKPQDELLYEFKVRNGTLKIFEREEEKYIFEWEKLGDDRPRPRIVDAMVGKFLCNLDNQTGEVTRRLYETRTELANAEIEERRQFKKEIRELRKKLLPHLIGRGELKGKLRLPEDTTRMVYTYWLDQKVMRLFSTKEEREQLESLGEF